MPIVHQANILFPIHSILVDREARQRKDLGDLDGLKRSLAKNGLLNPIVVSRETMVLKAGERRLTAAKELGWENIPVTWAEDLSEVESQIIELEENIKRKDLEWMENVNSIAKIHALYQGIDPEWTMSETADAVSLDLSTVSMYLRVHAEMANPRVAEATGVREAYNIIARKDQRLAGDALAELLENPSKPEEAKAQANESALIGIDPAQPGSEVTAYTIRNGKITTKDILPQVISEGIIQASFLEWAPKYGGPKFNLVHCDFPYGVNLFDGPQGRGAEPSAGYVDTQATYDQLIECLCANLDRIMSVSGHLMFWLSADYKIVFETIAKFNKLAPSLVFYKFPMIWSKSDNAGIAAVPSQAPRHVYEVCLLATRSSRNIVRVVGDAYSAPTDKKLHPSTKPKGMLKHFMAMLVDEHTTMFDPTCGSGASLRAAEELGAKRVLGLEIDPDFAKAAQDELKRDRLLRKAEMLLPQGV